MKNIIEQDLQTIIDGVGYPIMQFEGKEILITGACGFLGSWYIAIFQYLNQHKFKRACKVYAVDSFIAADKLNSIVEVTDSNIQFKRIDINEMTFDSDDKVDFIIHAAGIASPIYYRKFPIETIEGMVMGLHKLLNFAARNSVKSFLFFSSSEMYGNPTPENVPTKETYYGNVNAIGPRSCYDESKRIGETMCMVWEKIHGVPVKWVRPFNVYGPGMRVSDDRVIPKFTFQLLKGENITVHTPGEQTRTFCYITDAMIGFLKAMLIGKNGEAYNIGNSTPELTIKGLAEIMQEKFQSKSRIIEIEMPKEYPRDQAQRRCPDLSKAREHLSYLPTVELNKGLTRTYHWCKEALNG